MADSDLAAAMARVAELVEAALEALLPEPEGAEARLADAMRYATLGGGKRLRAFLVMESAALFAVSETCAARVAASIEMLHAYSLVHDDLPAMDDDDLRRGKPRRTRRSTRPRRSWPAMRCRLAPSRSWPNPTRIRTHRHAANWSLPWARRQVRAAWRAAR